MKTLSVSNLLMFIFGVISNCYIPVWLYAYQFHKICCVCIFFFLQNSNINHKRFIVSFFSPNSTRSKTKSSYNQHYNYTARRLYTKMKTNHLGSPQPARNVSVIDLSSFFFYFLKAHDCKYLVRISNDLSSILITSLT